MTPPEAPSDTPGDPRRPPHEDVPPEFPVPIPDAAAEEAASALDDLAAGYLPPDPDEAPPIELWRAVGDMQPWGTLLVLFPCAAMFLLLAARHALGEGDALAQWGANATGLMPLDSAWRLLASTFLHSGTAHLFFNATTLLIFGPAVERVYTRWAYWIVYAAGGMLASLASLAWRSAHGSDFSYSVGASGAIFALGGALIVGAIRLRHRLAVGRARSLGAAVLAGGALFGMLLGLNPRLGGRGAGAIARVLGVLAVLALASSLALGIRSGLNAR
jgi:membrane associated rhomboid family serine protease